MYEYRQYDYDRRHRATGEILRYQGAINGSGCTEVWTKGHNPELRSLRCWPGNLLGLFGPSLRT